MYVFASFYTQLIFSVQIPTNGIGRYERTTSEPRYIVTPGTDCHFSCGLRVQVPPYTALVLQVPGPYGSGSRTAAERQGAPFGQRAFSISLHGEVSVQ